MYISNPTANLKAQIAQERLVREKEFHDQWASSIDVDTLLVKEIFEAPTAIENQYILSIFEELNGKKILDLGCGAGEASVYFAMHHADVYGYDLSRSFLDVASALASKFNVKISLAQGQSEWLPYNDDSFDFIYGNGILHHVDLMGTAREIYRVLKPGGKAVFIEPLPYNPIINIYRFIAKNVRTKDEKPLSYKQLKRFGFCFSKFCHREFWLFSLLIFFHFYFIQRWNPSQVRYWKKVIEKANSYTKMFSFLQTTDKLVLRYFPWLSFLCWNTVVYVEK